MNLLFYAMEGQTGRRLWQAIDEIILERPTEIYRTIESFTRRLRQPEINGLIAVIFAADDKEFDNILDMGDLLRELRTIIILPDRKDDTVSRALTLYPRFISYADSDFSDVAAVLNKMIDISFFKTNTITSGS